MSLCVHLGWFVLLALIAVTTGFGNGAPKSVCDSMEPNHANTSSQTSASPYTLCMKRSENDNDTMLACIKGKIFKGIMGQIRKENEMDPIGTFDDMQLPAHTKVMNCSNEHDTVTQSDIEDKPIPTCFIWKIHDHNCKDRLQFVATINENKNIYWVQVKSDVFVIAKDDHEHDGTTPTTGGATVAGLKYITFAFCSLLAVVAGMVN